MIDLRNAFGFHGTPFTCELPIDKRFQLPFLDDALAALERTVDRRMSAVVIGPAGTGKTVVLRALRQRLPEARYQVRYVKVTDLSKRDMCREISTAVGADPAGSYPVLVRRLQERFLCVMDRDGLRPVVLVDEAHDMRPDVLGMLRLLMNFEMDSKLVVSVILAGQPSLTRLLRRDELCDVARRLAHCASLRLLARDEMQRYVLHRLSIAGARDDIFAPQAMDALYELGRGNLRATDFLALGSLEVAATRQETLVDSIHVTEAARNLVP